MLEHTQGRGTFAVLRKEIEVAGVEAHGAQGKGAHHDADDEQDDHQESPEAAQRLTGATAPILAYLWLGPVLFIGFVVGQRTGLVPGVLHAA